MSASRVVTISCDRRGCARRITSPEAHTATLARTLLKDAGWRLGVYGSDRVTRDYCPDHAAGRSRTSLRRDAADALEIAEPADELTRPASSSLAHDCADHDTWPCSAVNAARTEDPSQSNAHG